MKFMIGPIGNSKRDNTDDKIGDWQNSKDSVSIFNEPTIINVKSMERPHAEWIDNSEGFSIENTSKLRVALCSLFKVCCTHLESYM